MNYRNLQEYQRSDLITWGLVPKMLKHWETVTFNSVCLFNYHSFFKYSTIHWVVNITTDIIEYFYSCIVFTFAFVLRFKMYYYLYEGWRLSHENYFYGTIDRSWRNMGIYKWKWVVLDVLKGMNNVDIEKKVVFDVFNICQNLRHVQVI